jgi:hypothetical protein
VEDGVVVIIVGLVLCFVGAGSLQLAVFASGFGACWLLAELSGAEWGTALVVALGGAFLAWLVIRLVFGALSFVLGAVVGAVIGVKLYTLLHDGEVEWLLAAIVVAAVALACGFLAVRVRERFLVWATALGGAALILNGLARAVPELDELRSPAGGAATTIATVAWVALAIGGGLVQRRFFIREG